MFKDQIGFLTAVAGGLFFSVILSEKRSVAVALARIGTGLFCSFLLTDIVIHRLGLPPDIYRDGVAGLMAMMGYAVTRFLVNVDRTYVLELIKSIRGIK